MTKKLKALLALVSCVAVIFAMSLTASAAAPTREQLYEAAKSYADTCFQSSYETTQEYDDLTVTRVEIQSEYVYEVTVRANQNRYICEMVISYDEDTATFTLDSYDVVRENSTFFGWIGYMFEVIQKFFLEMFSGNGIYTSPFYHK